jgi:sugar lactone lactonase YvrE
MTVFLTVALALAARAAPAQSVQTIIGPSNEDGLPATRVMLHAPVTMAMDATGALYVLENGYYATAFGGFTGPSQVRRIAPDGTITRVVAPRLVRDTAEVTGPARVDLGHAMDLTVDRQGNLYIADEGAHRIWKVDPQGVVSTLAGRGTPGRSGDGGPADQARLNGPRGVALDSAGNLYIADTFNHSVRRVATDGTISTVAGRGSPTFSGDGGPAVEAGLSYPRDIALDAQGNLYIADHTNRRLRRVNREGVIETVRAGLGEVRRLALDGQGNVYVSSFSTHRIRKVAPDGTMTTVAGGGVPGFSGDGGKATEAQLSYPAGVLVDVSGNLLIVDIVNGRIRRVALDGTISTVAGGGDPTGLPASQVSVFWPRGGVRDAQGNFYVADNAHARILKIDPEGIVTRIAGTGVPGGYQGEGLPAREVSLGNLRGNPVPFHVDGLALDSQGNLYFPDQMQRRVYKLDPNGILTTVAGNGRIGFSGDGGLATEAALSGEFWNVAADTQGNLYISDGGNHRVRRVDRNGIITTVAGNGQTTYRGDGGSASETGLRSPDALTVDAQGNLSIGDVGLHRIFKVTPDGTISTVAGTGARGYTGDGGKATEARIGLPENIAVDGAGNLYFADRAFHCIRRVTPEGIISTVAGTGEPGFNGDGMAPLETNLTTPVDLYLDAAGNLIVAEEEWISGRTLIGHRVRLITPAP